MSRSGQVPGRDGVVHDSYWGEQSIDGQRDSPLSSCISNGNRSINTHFIQEKNIMDIDISKVRKWYSFFYGCNDTKSDSLF